MPRESEFRRRDGPKSHRVVVPDAAAVFVRDGDTARSFIPSSKPQRPAVPLASKTALGSISIQELHINKKEQQKGARIWFPGPFNFDFWWQLPRQSQLGEVIGYFAEDFFQGRLVGSVVVVG